MSMALFQNYQHASRKLTEEERSKLESDSCLVSDFKKNKLEQEAQRNWDLFYKRNSTNFFKDRHWTTREFQELCSHEGDMLNTREVVMLYQMSFYRMY